MTYDIDEKLQELFIKYAKSLPDKIASLQRNWSALQQSYSKKLLVEFHRDVHSLCGSSGTYGYPALSQSARDLEAYLKTLLNNEVLSKEEQNKVTEYLAKIKVPSATTNPIHKVNISSDTIYIYDTDNSFYEELKANLSEASYCLKRVKKISNLAKIMNTLPLVVILNIEEVNDKTIASLSSLQTQHLRSVPLLCIATAGDIITRLKAIRIGATAFFQKPIDMMTLVKQLDQLSDIARIEPYRILIIDDSVALAEYYSAVLNEAGMITKYITNPLLLIETIHDFQPNILLMDVYMPECSGLELAAALRQEEQYTKLPIIFLSTEADRFKQLSALNSGADDFLTKPINPQHLIKAVSSRAKRAEILNSIMMKDSLTGLLNHTNILQRLEIELIRAERQHEDLALIMLDIDHFKLINDTYGHPAGDKVIQKISFLLQTLFRKTDIIGRYGGEEFVIILPNTNSTHAFTICDNFRERFSQIIFHSDNKPFHVTVSAGISVYPALTDVKSIIAASDQALYTAKDQGRNRVIIFKS